MIKTIYHLLLMLCFCQIQVSRVLAAPPTLNDYWNAKASWKLSFTIPEGTPGWTTGFGAAAQIIPVGSNWYLFTRHVHWGQGDKMTLAVSRSTNNGATWSPPVDILTNTPSYQSQSATDGGAYYNTNTNTWHLLYQCLGSDGVWNGCHATRSGPDPLGQFTPDPQNPVIRPGSLWSKICDLPSDKCRSESHGPLGTVVDEGTFDIILYDGQYYWVSFHGYDGKFGFRGLTKTQDFHTWIAGSQADGVPSDAILNPSDASIWNVSWDGGTVGFGTSRTLYENGYWYQFAEAADKNLGSVGTDGKQYWANGIFRSTSLNSTTWEQPSIWRNPVNITDPALRLTDLAAASPAYSGLFRDQSGQIYMHFSRVGYQPQNSGIFFYSLQSNNMDGDLNSDGHINAADYTLFVAGYPSKYNIFDYAKLVANYNK